MMQNQDAVLAVLHVNKFRRVLGIAMLATAAVVLVKAAVEVSGGSLILTVILLALAAGVAWAGAAFYRATSTGLIFTADGLFDQAGNLLVAADNIRELDRGSFGIRPTNGLALLLHQPVPFAWKPGLYWAYKRRVGIGGANSKAAGKAFGDCIVIFLAERKAALQQ